jgi:hypothetical protein
MFPFFSCLRETLMHVQRIAGCSGSPEAPGLCHFNRKEHKMSELTQSELSEVSGGGPLYPWCEDICSIVDDLPNLYRLVINSMTEMICIGTGDC